MRALDRPGPLVQPGPAQVKRPPQSRCAPPRSRARSLIWNTVIGDTSEREGRTHAPAPPMMLVATWRALGRAHSLSAPSAMLSEPRVRWAPYTPAPLSRPGAALHGRKPADIDVTIAPGHVLLHSPLHRPQPLTATDRSRGRPNHRQHDSHRRCAHRFVMRNLICLYGTHYWVDFSLSSLYFAFSESR